MSEEFTVGDRVRIITLPRYVKTAEPMPMLRPPDVIQLGEEGIVLDRRPGGY
ncbi:MAG TPA: NAD(P)H dehydrogenase assembly family protein, partial [Coleofasciculaceae cyanobacterium]